MALPPQWFRRRTEGHTAAMLRDRPGLLASLPGHGELVRLRFGPQTMVMVCDPELVQQVLRDDRTFGKRGPFCDRAREIVGDGLASCPHDRHRRQRWLLVAAVNEWLSPARDHLSSPHRPDHGVACCSRPPIEPSEAAVTVEELLPDLRLVPAGPDELGTGDVPQLVERDTGKEACGL